MSTDNTTQIQTHHLHPLVNKIKRNFRFRFFDVSTSLNSAQLILCIFLTICKQAYIFLIQLICVYKIKYFDKR